MIDLFMDSLMDTLKILPFLFIAFLIMEKIEHEISNKKVIKSQKYGPFLGAILGIFPQCGFSVAATNLYSSRIITVGSLIAVYLSTSDEMLAIMISKGMNLNLIIGILSIKLVVAIISGLLIDKFLIVKKFNKEEIKNECEEEKCNCKNGIILSSIKHTLNIAFYLLILSFIINCVVEFIGTEKLQSLLLKDSFFGPFLSSFLGLIPNCAASILITELYLMNAITFGSMIAGLLTGSGVALLVLFKTNKNLIENFKIMLTLYLIGSFVGLFLHLI